jgi:dolichyl-phosphate-mannose-protein mannosyltransferase
MKPSDIALVFDADSRPPSPSSSDYEKVDYPASHSHSAYSYPSRREPEDLPLHYMTEDSAARRRVPRGPGASAGNPGYPHDDYDDSGKDVYSKVGVTAPRFGGGGRIARRGPPPPATSLVRGRPPPRVPRRARLTPPRAARAH